jgi:PAS domain S-box-containing protein
MSSPLSTSSGATDPGNDTSSPWFSPAWETRARIADFLTSSISTRRIRSKIFDLPWRLIIGAVTAAVPISILAMFAHSWSAAMAGVVVLVIIALASYFTDRLGGLTSLAVSLLLLDLYFMEGKTDLTNPANRSDRVTIVLVAIAGAVLIWLVQRIESESIEDRQDAWAARSAATALSAIETVAATQQGLSYSARRQIYDAIVRAVVGVNRAHAGALMLTIPSESQIVPDASYGFGEHASWALKKEGTGRGIVARIASERRPIQVYDLRSGTATNGTGLMESPVRSLLGAPIISADDCLLGVILLGLLVPHRFGASEVKKLEAFSSQIAAILETMSAAGEREFELQQARDEQRRLERVIAAIPEAVVVVSPLDGEIVATNMAARTLFGDLLNRDFYDALQSLDGGPVDEHALPMRQAIDRGESVEGIELVIRRKGCAEIPILASAAPIFGPEGSVVAVVSAFRDISTLKEAARIKDEFVSIVSHELRSPLTPIRGYVQLVARELSREGAHEQQVQRLHSIDGHVDRLTRLVDDLLDVSRMRAGSLEIRRETTDLATICRDVVSVRSANEVRRRIELHVPERPVEGFWDPDRLHQIVDNLVGNALKYSPDEGVVSVAVESRPSEAEIIVSDQGPGIAEDDREKVFGAFYRTASATNSQAPGLGLGLYICSELVEAHGGTIDVLSGPQGGAEFRVKLPRTVDESRLPAQLPIDALFFDTVGEATGMSPA